MVAVGPALLNDIDHRSRVSSKHGIVIGSQQPEFFDRIRSRLDSDDAPRRNLVEVRAVQGYVVLHTPRPIDSETRAPAKGCRIRSHDARLQQCQVKYIPPVQRQALDSAVLNGRSKRPRLMIQELLARGDGYRFRRPGGLQRNVERQVPGRLQLDALEPRIGESRSLDNYGVNRWLDLQELVNAGAVRLDCAHFLLSVDIDQGRCCSWNSCSRLICYLPDD